MGFVCIRNGQEIEEVVTMDQWDICLGKEEEGTLEENFLMDSECERIIVAKQSFQERNYSSEWNGEFPVRFEGLIANEQLY